MNRGWKRDRHRDKGDMMAAATAAAAAARGRKDKPGVVLSDDRDASPPPPPPPPPQPIIINTTNTTNNIPLHNHNHHNNTAVFLGAPSALNPSHLHTDCCRHAASIMGENHNNTNNNNNTNSKTNHCGLLECCGGSFVVRRPQNQDDKPAAKRLRVAEKVDPMFTVPAAPSMGSHPPTSSCDPRLTSVTSSDPRLTSVNPSDPRAIQTVRTRSIGTNTQDGGACGLGGMCGAPGVCGVSDGSCLSGVCVGTGVLGAVGVSSVCNASVVCSGKGVSSVCGTSACGTTSVCGAASVCGTKSVCGTSGASNVSPDSDPSCVEPCRPGTSVNLEGIVWHETQEGVLVVNVTWRKRTYVGTLLDCTKHDWAPPRFCESPCSDPELPAGGRGRGKRMRMSMSDRPACLDPSNASSANNNNKMRGISQHRSRGGGNTSSQIHNKGRRGSLNLINSQNCRSNASFFTVDDVKDVKPSSNGSALSSGKRKNKPPSELDLTLLSQEEMVKNGNGKRMRAKSRSAPSTPQGKSDPSFMDQGGGVLNAGNTAPPPNLPILIDCPHPNCTKRYKHINGLRYHQTHAHLEAEPELLQPVKDTESEDRLSDCEDSITNMTFDLSETNSTNSTNSKKPAPLYKVTTVGSPKNRRLLLSTDHSPVNNSKTRRTSILKDGLMDDLSNLPIISNMTVVLENCMVPDRNSSTVEMPKLEAEGLIDKKNLMCEKGKRANGRVEKMSKSRQNRPIAPAPAPPKLIAIPNTTCPANAADNATSPVGLASKNFPLKTIKPKMGIVVEPTGQTLVKSTLVPCSKETRKKEKRRLKDKHNKDTPTRTANGESSSSGIKLEESGGANGGNSGCKIGAKEISGSLLKEHLSKQDVVNGLSESQEKSRMASIRAEADKVYTFTDNAPSPSIGGSSRMDSAGVSIVTGDNNSKNNSPAYSDISDAGEDGGSAECRTKAGTSSSAVSSAEVCANGSHGNPVKTPPSASTQSSKDPQSPYYHGYEPYYLQAYMQQDRQNNGSNSGIAFHKSPAIDVKGKDRKDEFKEDDKGPSSHEYSDSKKGEGPPQTQLQLAMSQTQTALAQSLYYGQYSRGLYMDQKMLLASKCCEQQTHSKRMRDSDINDDKLSASVGGLAKNQEGVKGCCAKPVLSYVEINESRDRCVKATTTTHSGVLDQHQNSLKECDEVMKSPSSTTSSSSSSSSNCSSSLHNTNSQTDGLDSGVSFSSPPDGPAWSHVVSHGNGKYCSSLLQHGERRGEEEEHTEPDHREDWAAGTKGHSNGVLGAESKKTRVHGAIDVGPATDLEDCERVQLLDDDEGGVEPLGALSEECQGARVAVSPPMTPQQPYQYQHSAYQPYLALCDNSSLMHNYPGFHYPLYGKTAGREECEVTPPLRGGGANSKQSAAEANSQPGEKGSPEGEREREAERERSHVSFARHLHTHHHTHLGMSYNLLGGQYDIYQGLSSRSVVSSQQVSGHSSTDSEGKK